MGAYFNGPVDPGNPLIINSGVSSSGRRSSNNKGNSKSKKSIPKAYYGQTSAYELMNADKSLLVNQLKASLVSSLKNDFQGDKGAFLNSKETMARIKQIHELNAMSDANKNAIENEKVIGDNWYSKVSNEKAINDYAYDSEGNRFFLDNNNKLRLTKNADYVYNHNGRFLTNQELYDYQRRNLGIHNGVADQGVWTNSVDHKSRIFEKGLRNYILDAKSGYTEGGGTSGLKNSGVVSYLTNSEWKKRSNLNNLSSAISTMKQKMGTEAVEDARMQYWKAGWDQAVMVQVSDGKGNVKNMILNKDEYNRIKKKPLSKSDIDIANGKVIKSEDAKLDEFILLKAKAMANGNEQDSFINRVNYHKLTEGEADSKIKKMTFYGAVSNPEYLAHSGARPRDKVYVNNPVKLPTQDNDGIYHMQEYGNTFLLQADASNMVKIKEEDESYMKGKIDSNGNPDMEKLETMKDRGYSNRAFVGFYNRTPMPDSFLEHVKFGGRTGRFTTAPKLRDIGGGHYEFNINPNGGNEKDAVYQEIIVYATSEDLDKYAPYFVGEHRPAEGTQYEHDNNYTTGMSSSDINDDSKWFDLGKQDFDASKEDMGALGITATSNSSIWENDKAKFTMWVPVEDAAKLNRAGISANSHNLRSMNTSIGANANTKAANDEKIKNLNNR